MTWELAETCEKCWQGMVLDYCWRCATAEVVCRECDYCERCHRYTDDY